VGISEQVQVFEFEPTSLNRGEGLISELQHWFEGKMGGESDDGGSGMGEERMNLNRDGIDGVFKLCWLS
jgi:hypothetical protein